MSQQPLMQPQQGPHGYPQWGQQAPYEQLPNGQPLTQQPQGQYSYVQTQQGQQVPPSSFYNSMTVRNPPSQQQPFPPSSSSPYMSPQKNQRDPRPWYRRRGGKIALVCGLLVVIVLLGYGLTVAVHSFYGAKPSTSSTVQRTVASPTAAPTLAPTPTPNHKLKVTTTVVMLSKAAFSPATLTIAVGSTIIWKNTSPVPHTVTSDDGTFDSGDLPVGGTFRFTFTTAGKFHYTCAYHPWMTGTINVE
jgi:plastocyanin